MAQKTCSVKGHKRETRTSRRVNEAIRIAYKKFDTTTKINRNLKFLRKSKLQIVLTHINEGGN
jgi:hypothetical protein